MRLNSSSVLLMGFIRAEHCRTDGHGLYKGKTTHKDDSMNRQWKIHIVANKRDIRS